MPAERVRADVDGDGQAEELEVVEVSSGQLEENGDEPGTCVDWSMTRRIRGRLSSGSTLDQELPFDYWKPLGATEFDGDGRDELWFEIPGATAQSVGFLLYDDGEFVPPLTTDSDGNEIPASFVRSQNSNCCLGLVLGVRCVDVDGDGVVEIVETSYDEGLTFVERGPDDASWEHTKPETWGYTASRVIGGRLTEVASRSDLQSPPAIPGLDFEGGLTCQDVRR